MFKCSNVRMFECLNVGMGVYKVQEVQGVQSLEGKDGYPRVELLVRGKKSFGHVKIDAKRVSDSGVLCTVVDLHKREEL